jgi:RHS repeat-associated protein
VFTYDGAGEGLLTNVKDPRGFDTASSDHNDYGTPTTIRKALSGHVAIDVYDSRNRLIERRDEYQGTVIRRQAAEYDGFDRAVIQERLSLSGQPASDQRTETEYYPGGQPRVVTNALGGKTTYTLDGMNRVIATSTTVGYNGEPPVTTAFEFDGVGNKVAETDRRGVRGIHAYDALNRLTQTQIASGIAGEGPTGVIATYGYDLVGNKLFETDVNSFQTDYVYDDLHRIKTKLLPQQMPAGLTPTGRLKEEYTYDKVGNLLTSTDAGAYVTTREYDALDRVTKVIRDPRAPNPAGLELITTTRYCNDPAATPIGAGVLKCEEHEEKHGRRTLFEYDALNRETLKTVRLEGQDGNPATNNVEEVTRTDYFDSDRAHQITEQLDATRNMVTRVQLDGLDREVKRIHDFGVRNEVTQTTYDGAGNKKLVLEPRSNPSSFTYDALGRLRLATDAKVQNGVYTYDGAGLKLSETDRRGVQKAFTYDNLARARKSGLAAAPFSGVTWNHEIQYVDGLQPQRREIDAKGNVTVFDLDGLGRVIKETDPDGKYVETTWDGVNKRRVRNKEGHLTTYDYDAVNRPVKTTDPAPYQGQTVETTYDDANNRVTEKDREGTLTITQMDPLGRAVTVTRDGVLLARNTYDFLGNKVLIEDGSGKKTQFSYDTANRLESRVDGYGTPEAKTTQYRYDLSGNKTKEIDALSTDAVPSMEWAYDELNRVTDEWNGKRERKQYTYDEEGNRTSTTEAKSASQTTYALYDELGKVTQVTAPGNTETTFAYDAQRNLTRLTDGDGRVTTMEYDALNRLWRTTRGQGNPNLVTTVTEFDAEGRALTTQEPNGEITRQAFDELGRLKTRTYEAATTGWTPPWAYTTQEQRFYDPNSNLTRIEEQDKNADGTTRQLRVTARTYDTLDRQTGESFTGQDSVTRAVAVTYYANGRIQTLTDPRGTTSFTYDGQNRESTSTTSAGATTKTYYADGLLKDATFPNGTKRSYAYDDADRVTSIVTTLGAAQVASVVYTYDANGNRLSEVKTNGGASETTSYTYDDLDRLDSVTYAPDASHANGRKVTYGYDAAGNRTSEIVTDPVTQAVLESKTGVFDAANRLTQLTDNLDANQTTTLAWDANGNLRSEAKAGVTTNYRYDLRDTLGEVERGGQVLARFLGDFDERRVLKIGDPTHAGGSGSQEYLYHGLRMVDEIEGGQATARYEWTNDELISLFRSDGTRRYYALDGLESVLALTDEQGQAVERIQTDAWGVPSAGTDFGTSGNRYALTSHRYDTELGLYYAGARMYSPTIGRFITQDTLALSVDQLDSWNLFAYVRSNPLRYVDPTGHASDLAAAADAEHARRAAIPDNVQSFSDKGEGCGSRCEQAEYYAQRGPQNAPEPVRVVEEGQDEEKTDEEHQSLWQKTKGWIADKGEQFEELRKPISPESSTGDPIEDIQRSKNRAKEARRAFGESGKKVLEITWELTPGTQFVDIAGGEDIHGNEVDRASASGGVIVFVVAGRAVYKIGTEVVSLARAARASRRSAAELRREAVGLEREAVAAQRAARRAPAADNYRGRYNASRAAEGKARLPEDYDAHHRIPRAYEDHPEFSDFDFHDPANIHGVPGSRTRMNVHQEVTNEWEAFREANPNASREQIEDFAKQIDKTYGGQWFK